MKIRFITFIFLVFIAEAYAQEFAGFQLVDYLSNVAHPRCQEASNSYILGPPNDSMWVNLIEVDTIAGDFGYAWTNGSGPELILHSAFNRDKYLVRLQLNDGRFSNNHEVKTDDWIILEGVVPWTYLFDVDQDCKDVTGQANQVIVALDFEEHFALNPNDIVTGIEIILLITSAATDISGVYLTDNSMPCQVVDLGTDRTICSKDSIVIDPGEFENLLWMDSISSSTLVVGGASWDADIDQVFVQAEDFNGCISHDTITIEIEKCFDFNILGTCRNVLLYPNPSNEELNIAFGEIGPGETIEIYSYQGKLIQSIPVFAKIINLDVKQYPAGLYLAKINFDICKFVKQE